MIKKTLILGLFFMVSASSFGQTSWGAKGGLNVSTLGTNSSIYTPRLTYHAGFYYMQRLEQQYGLQVELQYSQQGARDASINNRRLSYNYLNLPILMKFYLPKDTYIDVGPQVSYLMKANSVEEGFKDDITEGLRKWDVSMMVGFGKESDFGNFGMRFGWGFLNTSGTGLGTSSLIYRNLLLQLYVGFKFQEKM